MLNVILNNSLIALRNLPDCKIKILAALLVTQLLSLLFQDSLTSADTLVKKHEGFEKTLQTQAEKIEELQNFASELIQGSHYDVENINKRSQAVLER